MTDDTGAVSVAVHGTIPIQFPTGFFFDQLLKPRIPTSGQSRINAKRARQAAYWENRRTIKVLVGGELIPHLDRIVQLLGDGAQLHRSTPRVHSWVTDLDVHIPGAPPQAHRAQPRFRSVRTGDRYGAELVGIDWLDARGRILPTPTP